MRLTLLFLLLTFHSVGQSSKVTLEGSSWFLVTRGVDLKPYTIVFLANGKLYLEGSNDTEFENDSWKLKGNKITICFNDKYAVYKGKLKDNLMVGKAKNKTHNKWEWSAALISDETVTPQ